MQKDATSPRGKIFYGWVVVAASLIIMITAYGIYLSWPVFYVAILEEYGWSRADTALIFSIASIIYGFAAPVGGALIDRFGPRKLFIFCAILLAIGTAGSSQSHDFWHFVLFYSIFVALGTTMAGFTPNSALISNWFVKKRATALGFALVGTRGPFILIPIIQLGILSLGWRNTYLVMAASSMAIIIPLAFLLCARPQDKGLLPDGDTLPEEGAGDSLTAPNKLVVDKKWAATEWTLQKALKERRFWALFALVASQGCALTPILNHQVAFVTDIGFSAMFAASLLTIYAIMTFFGRLSAFVSDIIGREVALTLGSLASITGIVMLLLVNGTSSVWMLYSYAILFGFFSGACGPIFSSASADLFQGKHFGAIFGFINIGYGLGVSLGNWLFGYIFDVTGNYSLAFWLVIFTSLTQAISVWAAAPRKVRLVAGIARQA